MGAAARWTAWAASGLLALVLLTHPISVQAQLSLSLAAIAAMIGLWLFAGGSLRRSLFLAIGGFVVIRYIYWRVTSTLPPISDPLGFGLSALLALAEAYCVLILTISLIINADPLKRTPLEREADAGLPTVDVFIPTYNEDEYILATTVAAAKSWTTHPISSSCGSSTMGAATTSATTPTPKRLRRRASAALRCN